MKPAMKRADRKQNSCIRVDHEQRFADNVEDDLRERTRVSNSVERGFHGHIFRPPNGTLVPAFQGR